MTETESFMSSELEPVMVRVMVPDIGQHELPRGEVRLRVPADFVLEAAFSQWAATGGQVRSFNSSTVDVKAFRFPDWLVRQGYADRDYDTVQ